MTPLSFVWITPRSVVTVLCPVYTNSVGSVGSFADCSVENVKSYVAGKSPWSCPCVHRPTGDVHVGGGTSTELNGPSKKRQPPRSASSALRSAATVRAAAPTASAQASCFRTYVPAAKLEVMAHSSLTVIIPCRRHTTSGIYVSSKIG